LARVGNATIQFNATTGSTYGSATTKFFSGSLAAPTNPMLGAYIVLNDGTPTLTYATYSVANGLADATLTAPGSATALNAVTTSQIADVTASFATSANVSVYAMRIGPAFALTGTNTITLGALASASDGAGLLLNTSTAQTHTPNFTFGTAGN